MTSRPDSSDHRLPVGLPENSIGSILGKLNLERRSQAAAFVA